MLQVEFSGGLELLFDTRHLKMEQVAPGTTIGELLPMLTTQYMLPSAQNAFTLNDSVRPGVLVLVNDMDWELIDTLHYKIQEGDTLTFISTLHGG